MAIYCKWYDAYDAAMDALKATPEWEAKEVAAKARNEAWEAVMAIPEHKDWGKADKALDEAWKAINGD